MQTNNKEQCCHLRHPQCCQRKRLHSSNQKRAAAHRLNVQQHHHVNIFTTKIINSSNNNKNSSQPKGRPLSPTNNNFFLVNHFHTRANKPRQIWPSFSVHTVQEQVHHTHTLSLCSMHERLTLSAAKTDRKQANLQHMPQFLLVKFPMPHCPPPMAGSIAQAPMLRISLHHWTISPIIGHQCRSTTPGSSTRPTTMPQSVLGRALIPQLLGLIYHRTM